MSQWRRRSRGKVSVQFRRTRIASTRPGLRSDQRPNGIYRRRTSLPRPSKGTRWNPSSARRRGRGNSDSSRFRPRTYAAPPRRGIQPARPHKVHQRGPRFPRWTGCTHSRARELLAVALRTFLSHRAHRTLGGWAFISTVCELPRSRGTLCHCPRVVTYSRASGVAAQALMGAGTLGFVARDASLALERRIEGRARVGAAEGVPSVLAAQQQRISVCARICETATGTLWGRRADATLRMFTEAASEREEPEVFADIGTWSLLPDAFVADQYSPVTNAFRPAVAARVALDGIGLRRDFAAAERRDEEGRAEHHPSHGTPGSTSPSFLWPWRTTEASSASSTLISMT